MQSTVNRWLSAGFAKPLVFLGAVLPFCWLALAAAMGWLGANPAEALERSSGDWTLRMLCIALAVTPLRTVLRLSALARFRRMIGLFVYFYAVLHFAAYAWFDMGLDLADIGKDIGKRPFVLVGFASVVLLTPLALTSFNGAMRWLGGRKWKTLHRLVYLVAGLSLLHFFWMRAGKNNFAAVIVYGLILSGLLAWRLFHRARKADVV